MRVLPIQAEHAEELRIFPRLNRHDPFDRLILAQALCESLTLSTSDGVPLDLDEDFILDSRT